MSTRTHTRRMDAAPPHDDTAERITLGALLSAGVHGDRDVLDRITAAVSAADYQSERHTIIHDAIAGLAREHDHYDAAQIMQALREAGHLERVGGADYLIELTEGVATAHTGPAHARRVRECAIRRRLMAEAERITHAASNGHALDDVLSEADRLAGLVGEARQSAGDARFQFYSASDFDGLDLQRDYHIPGVLAAGPVPTILAGSFKTLKTSVAMDLLMAVATGSRFLGHFPVSTQSTVAVMSGESGGFALQSLARRIAHARGWTLAAVGERFRICPDVLDLGDADELAG